MLLTWEADYNGEFNVICLCLQMSSIVSHAPEKNPGTENTFRAKASFKLSPPLVPTPHACQERSVPLSCVPSPTRLGRRKRALKKAREKRNREWKQNGNCGNLSPSFGSFLCVKYKQNPPARCATMRPITNFQKEHQLLVVARQQMGLNIHGS